MAAEDGPGRAARPGAVGPPRRAAPLAGPRSRSIRLADLLIEVESDLGFSGHFQQPGERVDPGEVCVLLAAILAHGCNLGLYTMEKVAPDIAYRRLQYVSDWRLVEENQRAALAAIVHGISRLDAAGHWGDGTTSASDGQRFAMPHKVLQRTYSTRFNDFALEFYSFVADNYAPFYSRPIECTDRDAPFVLDGVLYHESDLDLEEHYTNTHGYTEINFAAFGMIGMRFCPRIRSLHRQRIYCADPDRDASSPSNGTASASSTRRSPPGTPPRRPRCSGSTASRPRPLLRRQPGARPRAEDRVRAAVRVRAETAGQGAAGTAQGRAASRPRADRLLRQRGRISAREVYDQMNACSCLILILACIVYWQAREIWPPRRTSRSSPTCCGTSARSSGRTSSSTARSRSTPPSSRGAVISVYSHTNLVGTLLWLPWTLARASAPVVRTRPAAGVSPPLIWATPKSRIRIDPSGGSWMFRSLMSRWTTPRRWA